MPLQFSQQQIAEMTTVITTTLQQLHEAKAFGLGSQPGPSMGGEDVKMLMQEMMNRMKGGGGHGGGSRTILDERNFRRLEKFSTVYLPIGV